MIRSTRLVVIGAALAVACSSDGGGQVAGDAVEAVPETGGGDPGAELGSPDYGDVFQSPETAAYVQSYLKLLDESKDMTTDELFAAHYATRPYVAKVSYDATKADFMDLIDGAYALTSGEKAKLADVGFVVSGRVTFESHPAAFLDIYQKDLPVLVTTDSILFAIHKSYDLILKRVEEKALIPMLGDILSKAHATLAAGYPGASGVAADALSDTDLFYTVARSLLAGAPVAPTFPANAAARDDLLARIDALQPAPIELFGRAYPCELCMYDFSQFKPRGHYTETEELKRYFRAMIWLGRTELALTRFHRDFAVSWLLRDSVSRAGVRDEWGDLDRAIQAFVGKSDNLTLDGFDAFAAENPADLATVGDPAAAAALMEAMEKGGYAQQLIMSQIMMTDPLSSTPEPLPPIFEFLGQRFVIDSYVFASVVYDRIVFEGQKQLRYMPSPLDPMFVIGFQEALPLLKEELDEYHYAQNLHVLKYLVDGYDAPFWVESMYNTWLDAIRALAADTTGEALPEAARTLAYALKSMHAGLASWAELRHDTILYVKQSYTGVACDYPDGYVEPFPEFFKKIDAFAQSSSALFAGLDLPSSAQYLKPQVKAYFDALSKAAGTLGAIAAKEVAQQPRTPEETAFLKSIVQADSMCGSPPFSGWYRDLFFDANDTTFEFDPTVADVHTDPNSTDVLHVATGRADLMVMVADTTCGLKAYAGPASSYYEFREPGFARLTDEEWVARLGAAEPDRPAWTSTFVAK